MTPKSLLRSHDEAGAFQWLAQGPEIFARSAQVYTKLPPTVYLRAADTIHLATAAEAGFKVVYSSERTAYSGKGIRHRRQERYPVADTGSWLSRSNFSWVCLTVPKRVSMPSVFG